MDFVQIGLYDLYRDERENRACGLILFFLTWNESWGRILDGILGWLGGGVEDPLV